MEFPTAKITVTLTGAEWFAICAKLGNRPLSPEGQAALIRGATSMTDQLLEMDKRLRGEAPTPRPKIVTATDKRRSRAQQILED
jgi:hypothetical protein